MTHTFEKKTRLGITRTEVIVSSITIGLLFVIVIRPLAGQTGIRASSIDTTCRAHLQQIGLAVAACETEHNGFGPYADDGCSIGDNRIALSWTDLLYEYGYLPSLRYEWCPGDPNPGIKETTRGMTWNFQSVNQFNITETPKWGIRGSYGLNAVLAFGWPEDRYEDSSRQIYAVDCGWSWFGRIGAEWYMAPRIGYEGLDPVNFPNWQPTADWGRHCGDGADSLFCDGSARLIMPNTPADRRELLHSTFDTTQAFTWLPGEVTDRMAFSSYNGSVAEWHGRYPARHHGFHPDFPDELDPNHLTANNLWTRLPNADDRLNFANKGELNADGVLDVFDIDPFVLALTDQDAYINQYGDDYLDRADTNSDGRLDSLDIDGFVDYLVGNK